MRRGTIATRWSLRRTTRYISFYLEKVCAGSPGYEREAVCDPMRPVSTCLQTLAPCTPAVCTPIQTQAQRDT